MLDIGIFSAFFAGLLTFLAPCTLPLVPGYLAYLGGSVGVTTEKRQKKIFVHALCFVFGFTLVFLLLGFLSGGVGKYFVAHRALLSQIGGAIVILFGLSMIGFFRLPLMNLAPRRLPRWAKAGTKHSAFLIGFFFALGWSPCLGPILGTILVLASTSGSIAWGGLLLFVFSLGLALPFLFLAMVFERALEHVQAAERWLPLFARVGGVFFVLIGFLLLSENLGILTQGMSQLFDITTYDWIAERM